VLVAVGDAFVEAWLAFGEQAQPGVNVVQVGVSAGRLLLQAMR
jgi:hypothetical protein